MSTPPRRSTHASGEPKAALSRAATTWMRRLRRVYDVDFSVCANGGTVPKVLAVTTYPQLIASILAHLAKRQARAPPVVA